MMPADKGANLRDLQAAEQFLARLLGGNGLNGKRYLELGAGAFSLAAQRLGAKNVVNLDPRPDTIAHSMALWSRFKKSAHWQILTGSILDAGFADQAGTFDVVFTWGALNYTKALWEAIQHAGHRVSPGGRLIIAIDNKTRGLGGTSMWRAVKNLHHAAPPQIRQLLEGCLTWSESLAKTQRMTGACGAPPPSFSSREETRRCLSGTAFQAVSGDQFQRFMADRLPHFQPLLRAPACGPGLHLFVFRNSGPAAQPETNAASRRRE